jgi:hypothetical protein
MIWSALAAAAVLQLLAGVVRVRAWYHVIRHSCPDATGLRYRDGVLAHLGGIGWNAVLPARAGDAVKVVLVNRRLPQRRLALIASTLVPPALVEAAFTALLLAGLVATSVVSLDVLTSALPTAGTALVIAGTIGLASAAGLIFRHRLQRLASSVRCGLSVLGRPRAMATQIVPWLLAGRALRLLAFAMVLAAAGVALDVGVALALMALQGATPSAGATATAARIALLASVLTVTGATDVPAEAVAAALAAGYGLPSAVNLAVSALVIAWLLRTASPRRIIAYVRAAVAKVKRERVGSSASREQADAVKGWHGRRVPRSPQTP